MRKNIGSCIEIPPCPIALKPVLQAILPEYCLPLDGPHGVLHWARVLENGLRLSEETGANARVVSLFAVFHDSRRINESSDHGHGTRGAKLAKKLLGEAFEIPDEEFKELYEACCQHTDVRHHSNVTIQTCFDSDRLDLGRVGMEPHPMFLNTDAAKNPAMIKWADGRAQMWFPPQRVEAEWGIDVGEW